MNPKTLYSLLAVCIFPITVCADDSSQQLRPDHAERMKAGTELFQKTVRKTLLNQCLKCHGGEKVRGDFDLASRETLIDSGYIDFEDPASSHLLALVRHEEEPNMPPSGNKLTDSSIAQLQRWIELGAPYDRPLIEKDASEPADLMVTESDRDFWSFRPLMHSQPPAVESGWAQTDSDRFVLNKLTESGLQPNPPADHRSRIRRTYLDVIGLPPTPQQMEAALTFSHEELVNELLASPHYGERWARHWLDAARFAESHGFEQDYDRKFAYHYRDFVIQALNSDMPWDQFVRWQIAGDELAPHEPLAMMATGFLGAGVFPTQLTEKEFESARYDELDDMAATIGTAMLGLTVGCARCHDHKFDPIPVADYYRFVSTFTTTIRSEIDVQLDPKADQANLAQWKTQHKETAAARDRYPDLPIVAQRFDRWLEEDASTEISQSHWTILKATEATSNQNATTLTSQPDGAILASGKPPAKETYTIKSTTSAGPVRFIRIEALTHESMKRNGPGRAGNGNFALSNLKLFATTPGAQTRRTRINLISAKATHQQNAAKLSVAAAIDQDATGTGWAVDHGGIGKDQAAVFELEFPLEVHDETLLEFQLTFSNNTRHSLGRFRLSMSDSSEAPVAVDGGLSNSLSSALAALQSGSLKSEHRDTLFPLFAAKDPHWIRLNESVQTSLNRKPKPTTVKVQVSSEGFPPTKHHADGRGFPHFYPETHFLDRGDPNQKKGVAESGFLQVLMRDGKSSQDWQQPPPPEWTRTSYRRTGMANWITDTQHGAGHLLARVIANRIWHHHFGRGIVATPNDFGLQGAPPTHPELLDFLASRLIESGWSLKALHREILLSATWLQSTERTPDKTESDPENRLFWRFPTRRLEAEIVRDAMLAVSGKLETKMFGPGTLDPSHQRRSIYFMIKRSRLVPMMQIFDQPEPLSSQGGRPSTTIAPQALLFMNNQNVVKWSADFAGSVSDQETDKAIQSIYLRALGREPSPLELQQNHRFVVEQAASYQQESQQTRGRSKQLALADLCQVIFGLNEFIYLP